MCKTPHKDKLEAALNNPKCANDLTLLNEAKTAYEIWINAMDTITAKGKEKVDKMVELLNTYKDTLEVDLIATRGTDFIKRQKGQLKLDNSVLEEFLIHLVNKDIIEGLPTSFTLEKGPQKAFMSLSFMPENVESLGGTPNLVIKTKDQDFTIGKNVYYKLSSDKDFAISQTLSGDFFLAVLAAEVKVNYDKTMFQECSGTASRLKQGCPISKYYALVEYLDMQAEDCRLTDIDNVFLLRKAKRLPFEKRSVLSEVTKIHKDYPIDKEVVWSFVQEIQSFVKAIWYNPAKALERGSFV